MTVNAKFGNSLKFEPRGNGAAVAYGPVYGPAGFLAIRGNRQDVKISIDGTEWLDYSSNFNVSGYDIQYLKVVNNLYVIIWHNATTNKTKISTSSDGITWTALTDSITNTSTALNGIKDIAYYSGNYAAVNGTKTIYRSTNLINWSPANGTSPDATLQYHAITTYTSGSNTRFMAAGTNSSGDPIASDSVSTLGTWVERLDSNNATNPYGASKLQALTNVGATVYAAGTNGQIWMFQSPYWTCVTDLNAGTDFIDIKHDGAYVVALSLNKIVRGTVGSFGSQTMVTADSQAGVGYDMTQSPDHTQLAYGLGKWIYCSSQSSNGIDWAGFDYILPNQQPYLDYYDTRNWNDWKTIDFWTYLEHDGTIDYRLMPIASQVDGVDSSSSYNFWQIYFESQNDYTTLFIQSASINNGNITIYGAQTTAIPINQWFHTRIVIGDSVGAVYINGQRQNTNNYTDINGVNHQYNGTSTFGVAEISLIGGSLNIGRIRNGFENNYSRSTSYWIDEFMVNSEMLNAPTATSISVPTYPWNNTENTLLLLHFDQDYLDDNRQPLTIAGDLVSASSMTIDISVFHMFNVPTAMSSSSSMSCLGGKLITAQADFETITTDLITVTRGIFELADFTINSTIDLVSQRTRELQIDISANSTISTNLSQTKLFSSDFATTSTLTAQASDIVDMIVLDTTVSQITVALDRLVNAQSQMSVSTALDINYDKIDHGLIDLATVVSITCDARVDYSAGTNLHALTEIIAITNGVNAHVDLSSEFSMRATARVTLLDLGISYMIPYEDRAYIIDQEVREAMIEYEDRTDLIGRL
jgi:hypothetical protein